MPPMPYRALASLRKVAKRTVTEHENARARELAGKVLDELNDNFSDGEIKSSLTWVTAPRKKPVSTRKVGHGRGQLFDNDVKTIAKNKRRNAVLEYLQEERQTTAKKTLAWWVEQGNNTLALSTIHTDLRVLVKDGLAIKEHKNTQTPATYHIVGG